VWDESALPVPVSSVVLLPFEDQIVYDGWIGVKNIIFGGSPLGPRDWIGIRHGVNFVDARWR